MREAHRIKGIFAPVHEFIAVIYHSSWSRKLPIVLSLTSKGSKIFGSSAEGNFKLSLGRHWLSD